MNPHKKNKVVSAISALVWLDAGAAFSVGVFVAADCSIDISVCFQIDP